MKVIGSYPSIRLRRNRKKEWSRRLVQESTLSTSDLIWPIFISEGKNIKEPINLMPGVYRYSVDKFWKAPHFEKMLYDNGQLVSLYSEAFLKYQNPLYKKVVFETLKFVERELMSENGAFYSALDADSEGEEGKFYVWNEDELKRLTTATMRKYLDN